jgi:DNA-binding MarR family transcriptional regulator
MDDSLHQQAIEVAQALPRLIRRFFAIDTEGPAADLPVAQLRICGILHSGPRTMSALSRELGISLSAVTQLADRLERSGLVERSVEKDDHRVKCLQLTEHGRQVVETRNKNRTQRIFDALSQMAPDERTIAVDGVRTLAKVLADTDSGNDSP